MGRGVSEPMLSNVCYICRRDGSASPELPGTFFRPEFRSVTFGDKWNWKSGDFYVRTADWLNVIGIKGTAGEVRRFINYNSSSQKFPTNTKLTLD